MTNLLRYFKSLPQRAIDTGLTNEYTAQHFQTQIQTLTLETCLFTDQQALRAKNTIPFHLFYS
ncbi:MAG: hypothetical protein KBC27_03165 [Rickettsiales bacterium]|nr:hypothetical protein [Rickettsiales bacterium]